MNELRTTLKFYVEKISRGLASALPQPKGEGHGIRSFLRGALNPLALVSVVSFLLSLALLISQRATDLPSIARIGAAIVASSFGGLVTFATQGNPLQVEFGLHSITVAVIALAITYRSARLHSGFKPLHYALGVTTFLAALGFATQGNIKTTFADAVSVSSPSVLSLAVTFGLFWLVAVLGARRAVAARTSTPGLWAAATLKNFAYIYGALLVAAGITLWVSALINPTFALSTEAAPVMPAPEAEQVLWFVVAAILYSGNGIAQTFFGAAGVPIGIESHGFVSNEILKLIEPAAGVSFWALPAFGPWAYIGLVALVLVVALISGAVAARRLGIKISGVVAFWQTLVTSLVITFTVAYFAGLQITASAKVEETQVDSSIFWGVSFVGLILSTLVVTFVAIGGSNRLNQFTASAFPRVFRAFKQGTDDVRSLAGRVFGIAVSLLVIAAFLTPVAAASTNRIWGAIDGPGVLGQTAKEKLTEGDIAELKAYLQPKPGAKDVWFSDDILKAAQPSDDYDFSVSVMNKSDEPWTVGNLDAIVNVTLAKDGKSLVWPIDTTSEMTNPSWLIQHPKYTLKLAPTKLSVTVSKLLPNKGPVTVTINGKKLTAGTYLAIPGIYNVEAAGYKLIAPTKETVFTNSPNQKIAIGTKIALPAGADAILDKGILAKAKSCFTVAANGASECVSAAALKKAGVVVSGKEPNSFFDSSFSNFKVSNIVCDADARTEKLTSAIALLSTGKCSAEVTYTENFYKTTKKKVARYTETTSCQAAWVSYDGYPVTYTIGEDDWGDEVWGWFDDDGYLYDSEDVSLDACFYKSTQRVQDGFETKDVRGALLTKVNMKATVQSSVSVAGGLDAKNKFALKK